MASFCSLAWLASNLSYSRPLSYFGKLSLGHMRTCCVSYVSQPDSDPPLFSVLYTPDFTLKYKIARLLPKCQIWLGKKLFRLLSVRMGQISFTALFWLKSVSPSYLKESCPEFEISCLHTLTPTAMDCSIPWPMFLFLSWKSSSCIIVSKDRLVSQI